MHLNKHIRGRETEKDINDVMLLKRNGWLLSGAWTLILLLSLFWNWQQAEKRVYELAFSSLELSFEKDVVYRRWASDMGGVYVPVSKLSPNPYLSHIPERDVITAAGVSMTLVNPAYMTRLVQELGKQQYGIQNHITSLNPLRPENIPDEWEKQALNKFEAGAKKATAVMEIDGSPYMRLMRPFVTEESCLKCHGNQGYEVGDILGGISISTSAAPYLSYIKSKQYALFAGHGIVWLVGLFFITLMTLRLISVRMAGETERRQAEETLIRSERHLRDVLDNMVAMIGVLAPDGTLLKANRTSLEAANLKIEDVKGKFFEECYWWAWSTEVQKRLRQAIEKAATGQIIRYDEVIRVGEGKFTTIDFMLSPIKENGRITFLIPSATDITERKQAEDALRRNEARFRLLSEIAEKLLTSGDPEGIVDIICRKVMEHLDCQVCFNFLVDQASGKLHLNACLGIPDEEAAKIRWLDYGLAVCGCAVRDGVPIVAENIFSKVDSRTELVRSYGIQAYACHPMIARGRVIGTLSFGTKKRASFSEDDLALMRMVTHQIATAMERMRLIEELNQNQDELETRVEERTAELKKANEALERSNKALGEFAYVASHDLQEPLRKIQTFADRLKSMSDLEDDRARDYLSRIDKSSGRMRILIQDLLTYSRMAVNQEPFTRFNLKEPIEEALTNLQVLIEESRGSIDIGALPDIFADPVQIRQLFQNLVSNALKYRGDQDPVVNIYDASSETKRFYEIHVKDNGIGFDEMYLDKIFQPFQRLHGKGDFYQGTGIGLAICRRIVENHGGMLTARSQPGKGSTFIVKLPRKKSRLING
jgi:PAS domain S-box-containing protein